MQLMKNSGYGEEFRSKVLRYGMMGYNKILAEDMAGRRPLYRPKSWAASSRWLAKQKKKKNWLGSFGSPVYSSHQLLDLS